MYLRVGLHLVKECCDGTKLILTEGETLKVKKRNYLAEGGVETIEGKLDSILTATNEIRLDTSATMQSKYTIIPFGEIVDMILVPSGDNEPADEDVAVFDVKTKRLLTVTIPALLGRIADSIPDCRCKAAQKEPKNSHPGNEGTIVGWAEK